MKQESKKNLLSIVIPVFNEEKVLPELLKHIDALYKHFEDSLNIEILFIDDGSSDNSWQIIKTAARSHLYIRGFRFARNFGHQIALTCGYQYAKGDAVVTMDADLQDPPEVIEQMIAAWQEGADVVLAKRKHRKGENVFKRSTAFLFYRLINFLSPVRLPLDIGDFRLLSRKANEILKNLPERSRYLRGLVAWIGLPTKIVEYERQPRAAGETKYSLLRMIKFSLDGIVSMSSRPLKLSYMFALLGSLPFLLYLIGNFIAWKWYGIKMVPGWASLLLATVTFGFFSLIMLGLIGEYLARIYEDAKQRPMFILTDRVEQGSAMDINGTN